MNKKLILLSGGIGTRTGLDYPKQYHKVNGKSIVNHLLENIYAEFDEIIIVIDEKYEVEIDTKYKVTFASNGETRLKSLQNGLNALSGDTDVLFIHEAARPLLDKNDIEKHMNAHKDFNGVVSVEQAIDTMFRIDENGIIAEAIAKSEIVKGYNPQSYKWQIIQESLEKINSADDDQDLTQILDVNVKTINGINDLRKITTAKDIKWIEGKI